MWVVSESPRSDCSTVAPTKNVTQRYRAERPALAYLTVWRSLRPLRDITAGVEAFGRSQFDTPIPLRRRDELGDLSERINTMAASLLESERLAGVAQGHGVLQTESLELAALAREVAATQGLPLTLQLDESICTVQGDSTRLRLFLRNLIENAQRHAADAPQPPELFLRREADAPGKTLLALGLRDHGPGVTEEQLPHLAEAFYRPDSARTRSGGGVGLGLHLGRLVAQAHGGELRVRLAQPGLEVAMVWPA